jgi:hypothetical protein
MEFVGLSRQETGSGGACLRETSVIRSRFTVELFLSENNSCMK